jgi:hypothetical protein
MGDTLITKFPQVQVNASLFNVGLGNKKIKLWARLGIKLRTKSAHRTATVERFSPTLLAHAIAAQTRATPKQWQEPIPPVLDNFKTVQYLYMIVEPIYLTHKLFRVR